MEAAAADCLAQGIGKCRVYGGIDSKRGYKVKSTDPVPGSVVGSAKVQLSSEGNQGKSLLLVYLQLYNRLHSELRYLSLAQNAPDCHDSSQEVAEVKTVDNGFERRLVREGQVWKPMVHVVLAIFVQGHKLQVPLTRRQKILCFQLIAVMQILHCILL